MSEDTDEFGIVSLTVLNKPKVRAIIDQMHVRSAQPFSCNECIHCGSEGDGYEYNGSWSVCSKHPGLSNHPQFPFKIAPSCFDIHPDATELSALLYADYPDAPPGVFALSRAMDAFGRLSQVRLSDETFDAVFDALTDPIEWQSADADDPNDVEANWREMTGHATPAPEKVRAQPGHEDEFRIFISGWGDDLYDSEDVKYGPDGLKNAKDFAEIKMREIAIQRIIAAAGGAA